MQEEIEQKAFNIMISTTKLSARTVLRAVKAAFRLYQSKAFQGKQSVRTLLRQNRGVSSVEISKTGIRGLERYAKKYGIDYAIRKDSSEVPPRYKPQTAPRKIRGCVCSLCGPFQFSLLLRKNVKFRDWQVWPLILSPCG